MAEYLGSKFQLPNSDDEEEAKDLADSTAT